MCHEPEFVYSWQAGLAGRGLPTGCPASSQVPQVLCKPPASVPDGGRGAAPSGSEVSLSLLLLALSLQRLLPTSLRACRLVKVFYSM